MKTQTKIIISYTEADANIKAEQAKLAGFKVDAIIESETVVLNLQELIINEQPGAQLVIPNEANPRTPIFVVVFSR